MDYVLTHHFLELDYVPGMFLLVQSSERKIKENLNSELTMQKPKKVDICIVTIYSILQHTFVKYCTNYISH